MENTKEIANQNGEILKNVSGGDFQVGNNNINIPGQAGSALETMLNRVQKFKDQQAQNDNFSNDDGGDDDTPPSSPAGMVIENSVVDNEGNSYQVYIDVDEVSKRTHINKNELMAVCNNTTTAVSIPTNLVYTRYADDITISSTKQIDKNLEKEIARLLAEHNMELNYKKTHFYGPKSKKIITGISISSGSPMLPRQTKRAWRQEINMIQKFGLLKHMENTKQLNPLFIPSLKGKLLFWKHIEPTNKFIDKGFIVLDEALKELD